MATGDFSFMSEDGKWMRPSRKPFIKGDYYTNLLRSNFIEMTATCLFRRDVFDRIGLFNQTLGGGEDYDLYLRIVREFPIICHPDRHRRISVARSESVEARRSHASRYDARR